METPTIPAGKFAVTVTLDTVLIAKATWLDWTTIHADGETVDN